jgi:hypothetical protein
VSKPLMPIAKVAPPGKVFALAIPVQRGGLTGFSILTGAGTFHARAAADNKRGSFPPAARVTVVLIDEPQQQQGGARA